MSEKIMEEIIEINGLKWRQDELKEIADLNNNTHVRLRQKDISRIPLLGFDIYFHEDVWDFSQANILHLKKKFYIYDFSDFHYVYKPYVKRLILQYLLNRLDYSSISKKFRLMKTIIGYLIKKHIYDPQYITPSIINLFCEDLSSRDINEEYRKDYKNQFKDILKNITYYNDKVNFKEHYDILSQTDYDLIEAEREDGKTPNIPRNIFNLIISCCLNDIRDESITFREKMAACVILILTQVGMRIGELRLLEADRKTEITLFNGNKASKLEFKSYKTVRSREFVWTKSCMTPHTILAYETLEEITALKREECKTNYLISSFRGKVTPYDDNIIRRMILNFMAKHHIGIPCINRNPIDVPGFLNVKIGDTGVGKCYFIKKSYKMDLNEEDIIAAPTPHQFRVAVCNELIRNDVKIEWVREHMNHITTDMTLHYRRKVKEEQESMVVDNVLKGIVRKDFRLIGIEATALIEKIEEVINENKYNVMTDLDKIIKVLKGRVPIRQKKEGYCIKSAFGRKCQTSEIMCAFDLCPNHIVNYQCIDITYKRFCEGVKIIKYNMENDYKKEAEMETKKLKKMVSDYLIPEIDELKYEINRQGLYALKSINVNIVDIINNISTIEKEAKEWI